MPSKIQPVTSTTTVVFSASSALTLMFAQAIAMKRTADGDCCKLFIWSFSTDSKITQTMQRMVVPDLWRTVVVCPIEIMRDYRVSNLPSLKDKTCGEIGRIAQAQQHFDAIWQAMGDCDEIVVCTTNPIDLRLCQTAPTEKIVYLEDGLQAYFDHHYTTLAFRYNASPFKRFKQAVIKHVQSLTLSLHGVAPASFVDPQPCYDYIYAFFPERHAQKASNAYSIKSFLTEETQGRLEEQLPGMHGQTYETVYLTRPDSEDGLCPEKYEIEQTIAIINRVAEAHGQVWLKPHPRDKQSKIEAILRTCPQASLMETDGPYPVELLARQLKIKRVYGTWSAALIYLRYLYAIETYCLLPYLSAPKSESLRPLQCINEKVRRVFPNEMHWIDSLEQIAPQARR